MEHWYPPKVLSRLSQLLPDDAYPTLKKAYMNLDQVIMEIRLSCPCPDIHTLLSRHRVSQTTIPDFYKILLDCLIGPNPTTQFDFNPVTKQSGNETEKKPIWYAVAYHSDFEFGYQLIGSPDNLPSQTYWQRIRGGDHPLYDVMRDDFCPYCRSRADGFLEHQLAAQFPHLFS